MAETRKPKSAVSAKTRCEIYTRKSSDEGLHQDFNALDIEERVDAPNGLECDRGDLLGVLALADIPFHVSQLKELAAGV